MDVLEDLALETGKSVAQIALNWLLQRPTVCSLVIGASSEEQLRQNFGAVDWKLSVEQINRLDVASKTDKPYPYWHQYQRPELSSQVF